MDDNEVSLPKATIVKLIKDYMPADVRVASDTSDMLLACCTEFVQLVSSEANTVAEQEGKKTIQPEHVLSALTQLGFPEYCTGVSAAWESFKEEAKASSSQKAALRKTGADQAGLSQEEQIALQQQMFAAARAASLTSADTAAAMAAAYQAQLAAHSQQQLQQQQQQPVAPVPVPVPAPVAPAVTATATPAEPAEPAAAAAATATPAEPAAAEAAPAPG